jgi:hypothetical protein
MTWLPKINGQLPGPKRDGGCDFPKIQEERLMAFRRGRNWICSHGGATSKDWGETLMSESWKLLGDALLFERHTLACECSYCKEKGRSWFGFRAPAVKYWKSGWYRFHFRNADQAYYLRFTMPRILRKIKR